MPQSEAQASRDLSALEVLTLPEAAEYLRVPEEAVLRSVKEGTLPAQRIGGEWRFLKRAVVEWLRFGPYLSHELRMYPPWMLDYPSWKELCRVIEQQILDKLPAPDRPSPKPGSKEAILRHFGVFQDDADLEEQLERIRAGRGAAGE